MALSTVFKIDKTDDLWSLCSHATCQPNRLNNYKQSKHFRKQKTKRSFSKCLSTMMNKNLCNTSWENIEKDCKKVFILSAVQSKYPQNKQWFPGKTCLCVCIWEDIILLEFSKEKIVRSFISQDGRTRIGTHYSILNSAYIAMDMNLKLEYLTFWKKKV